MVPTPPSPPRNSMLDKTWGRSLGMRFLKSQMPALHSLSTEMGDEYSSTMVSDIFVM